MCKPGKFGLSIHPTHEPRGGRGRRRRNAYEEEWKKEKTGATSLCANGLFYRFIDLSKHDPASQNKTHLEHQSPRLKSQVRNEAPPPPTHRRQGRLLGAGVSEDVSRLSAQLVAASAKNTSTVYQRTKQTGREVPDIRCHGHASCTRAPTEVSTEGRMSGLPSVCAA